VGAAHEVRSAADADTAGVIAEGGGNARNRRPDLRLGPNAHAGQNGEGNSAAKKAVHPRTVHAVHVYSSTTRYLLGRECVRHTTYA